MSGLGKMRQEEIVRDACVCVKNERIEASPGERSAHLTAEQYRWARVTSERKARTGLRVCCGVERGGEGVLF